MTVTMLDIVKLSVVGSIFLCALWKLLCYELRIHFANNYLVKIKYKIEDTGIDSVAKYAVKAYSENDAYIYAMKQYMRVRNIGDVQSTEVMKVD